MFQSDPPFLYKMSLKQFNILAVSIMQEGEKTPALIDYCILLPLDATINNSKQWGFFVCMNYFVVYVR